MKFYLGTCLVLIALILSGPAQAQQCTRYVAGGSATDEDYAYGYAADSVGNQYLCGAFHGNATFGNITLPGTQNGAGFLAKFNPQGGCDWAYRIGSFDDIAFFDVGVDRQGNVHTVFFLEGDSTFLGITAQGDGAAVYAVLNPQGGLVRSHVFTEQAAYYDMAIDALGNVYLTGEYRSAIGSVGGFPVPGEEGYLIVKLDASANPQWVRSVSRQNQAAFHETPHIGPRPGGGVVFNAMYFHEDMLGSTQMTSSTGQGLLVARYDPQGNPMGHWTMPSSDLVVPVEPAFDNAGNLYSGGYHEGSITAGPHSITTNGFGDAFLIKLQPTGTVEWAHSIGTDEDETGDGLVYADGRLFLSMDFIDSVRLGNTRLTGRFDIALAEITTGGQIIGASKFGGPGVESGFGLTRTPAGEVVVFGSFQDAITSGACQMTSHGENDAFAAAINITTGTGKIETMAKVALLPNPASGGSVRITGVRPDAQASVSLRDASGRMVASFSDTPLQLENRVQAQLFDLAGGLYLVTITQGRETHRLKWVVER